MRRVVTGMGIVSPWGTGLDHNWTKLIAAKAVLAGLKGFRLTILPVRSQAKCLRTAQKGR